MPGFGVVVAVIGEGRIALQLREDAGLWNLPGGVVENGESLAEAAIREVREEIGLVVRLTRLVGVYSRPRWLNGGNHQILFAAEPIGGDLRQYQPGETLDARFFDPADLPSNLLWWHRRLISDAIDGIGDGVARTLNAVWPLPVDRKEMSDAARQDPDLAERLRAAFTTPPAQDAERLDVGPSNHTS